MSLASLLTHVCLGISNFFSASNDSFMKFSPVGQEYQDRGRCWPAPWLRPPTEGLRRGPDLFLGPEPEPDHDPETHPEVKSVSGERSFGPPSCSF